MNQQKYAGSPKWFHPRLQEQLPSEITEIDEVKFVDGDVIVVTESDYDTVSTKLTDKFDELRVVEYIDEGIVVGSDFQ